MKKRIVAIIVAMATVFSMTGCESEEIRAQVEARAKEAQQQDVEEEEEKEQEEEKEEKEQEVEKEDADESSIAKNDNDVSKSAESDTIKKDFSDVFGKSGIDMDNFQEDSIDDTMGSSANDTGYLGNDPYEISQSAQADNLEVKELALENIDSIKQYNENGVIYHFSMYNDHELWEVDNNHNGSVYVTDLISGDETYLVLFGNSSNATYSEAQAYCEYGTTMEYWAFGAVVYDNLILVPVIAGTEEMGYYGVRPVIASMGMDVSDMKTLEEQNIDFSNGTTQAPSDESDTTGDTGTIKASDVDVLCSDSIKMEIDKVDVYEYTTFVDYTMINNCMYDAYIDDATFLLNGVDITDDCISFFYIGEGKTQESSFSIGTAIKKGDILEIRGNVEDEDYDDRGTVSFTILF